MAAYHRHFCQFVLVIFIFCLIYDANARIHRLKVELDGRSKIDMSTFGFLKGGHMEVDMVAMAIMKQSGDKFGNNTLGFTLEKTMSLGLSSDNENNFDCPLHRLDTEKNESTVFFLLDLDHNPPIIHVKRRGDLRNLNISLERIEVQNAEGTKSVNVSEARRRRSLEFLRDSYLMAPPLKIRMKRDLADPEAPVGGSNKATDPEETKVNPTTPKPTDGQAGKTTTKGEPGPNDTPKSDPKEPDNSDPDSGKETDDKTQPEKVDQKPELISEPQDKNDTGKEDKNEAKTEEDTKKEEGVKVPDEDKKLTVDATPGLRQYLTNDTIPVKKEADIYSFHFVIWINSEAEEGLYNFFFHNCEKQASKRSVNFTMAMVEQNMDNYLSAGEMPLPTLYFLLCLVHVGLALMWLFILRTSAEGVYKLHYLMLALLFVKAMALLFHGLNYYFIQKEGHHEEAFAVLYYITYLMRGMLLFVTILLIGAGWAFIKHVLSSREKRIFIIVIPLQILSNVAQIIIEETEEGQMDYQVWKEVLIAVDLICCGAILFPVVWSIRHLQWASQTDGKAAINLQKLKLFRHFYIMIVCYIYFSRIIVILVNITVPFRYEWIQELFKEATTLVFFMFTGYKFRPASNNPYLQVPSSDDEEDLEMDSVVSGHSGALEGLTRVNQNTDTGAVLPAAAAGAAGATGGGNAASGPKQREASHEYD